jgi:hypothetical protein
MVDREGIADRPAGCRVQENADDVVSPVIGIYSALSGTFPSRNGTTKILRIPGRTET